MEWGQSPRDMWYQDWWKSCTGVAACSSVLWSTGIIPTDWKRGLVVPLWKWKGDRQDCYNYRGVMLLSVPGKVFARIILDRVRHHLLEHQFQEHSGFTPKRSMIDCILALRVLTECRRAFQQGLLAAYIDHCKAFDSVNRDAIWRILGLPGVPPKLINLMCELYSGTESAEMWLFHLQLISSCYWSLSGVCTGPHTF